MKLSKIFRKLREFTEKEAPCDLDRAAAVLMKKDGSECIIYCGNIESVNIVMDMISAESEFMQGKSSRSNDDEVSKAVDDLMEFIVKAKRREKTAKED